MSLANPLIILTILFALLGILFFVLAVRTLKKKKLFSSSLNTVIALLMLSLSVLCGTITIAIKGYYALTREDLAATVKVEPAGEQTFIAHFFLPDGSRKDFSLGGDQLYVDAHILKWKPWANILGLHTSYELDRVAGRYATVNDETTKPRTVYSLSKERPLDMFNLRQRFAMLNPMLDAEYGSATYINTNAPSEFRVMVSTTGLLIRTTEKKPGK